MDVKKGEKQLCPHDHVWHGTNEFLMPALDRKAPRDEIRLFKANLPDLLLRNRPFTNPPTAFQNGLPSSRAGCDLTITSLCNLMLPSPNFPLQLA